MATILALLAATVLAPPGHAETCQWTQEEDFASGKVVYTCKKKVQTTGGGGGGGGGGSTAQPPAPPPTGPTVDAQGCYVDGSFRECNLIGNRPSAAPAATPSAAPRAPVSEETIREASAQIVLPEPDVKVGPDPSVNKWNAVAVGFPLWLSTSGPKTITTDVSAQGIDIHMEAKRARTTFDMGDGTVVKCTSMSKYPGYHYPPRPSPDCGHRYQQLPPKVGAGYTVTVTTHWRVTWTAADTTGEFMMTRSGSRHLNVIEIHSVIVAR